MEVAECKRSTKKSNKLRSAEYNNYFRCEKIYLVRLDRGNAEIIIIMLSKHEDEEIIIIMAK